MICVRRIFYTLALISHYSQIFIFIHWVCNCPYITVNRLNMLSLYVHLWVQEFPKEKKIPGSCTMKTLYFAPKSFLWQFKCTETDTISWRSKIYLITFLTSRRSYNPWRNSIYPGESIVILKANQWCFYFCSCYNTYILLYIVWVCCI